MNQKITVPTPHRIVQLIPEAIQRNPDKLAIYRELERHSKALYPGDDDGMRIAQFISLADTVRGLPTGEYAELGTYEGGTARWIWRLMRRGTKLYCFDTFDGFTQADMDIERDHRPNHGWTRTSFKPTTVDGVRRVILMGEETDRLVLVKGKVPDTLADFCDLRLRFVHVDMDLYEPTRHAVAWAWPRLEPGGVIVFHDYGSHAAFPGVSRAVDDYFIPLGLVPITMGDFWGSAVFVKPGA